MDTRRDFIIFIKKFENPYDKLICNICGGQYTRNKQALHYGTKKHKLAQAKRFRVTEGSFILNYD